MSPALLPQSSAPLPPHRSDTDAASIHSARYRLKAYARARDELWAAIALAEAGDVGGAGDLLETARARGATPAA
jgi:hypothetical protein